MFSRTPSFPKGPLNHYNFHKVVQFSGSHPREGYSSSSKSVCSASLGTVPKGMWLALLMRFLAWWGNICPSWWATDHGLIVPSLPAMHTYHSKGELGILWLVTREQLYWQRHFLDMCSLNFCSRVLMMLNPARMWKKVYFLPCPDSHSLPGQSWPRKYQQLYPLSSLL